MLLVCQPYGYRNDPLTLQRKIAANFVPSALGFSYDWDWRSIQLTPNYYSISPSYEKRFWLMKKRKLG